MITNRLPSVSLRPVKSFKSFIVPVALAIMFASCTQDDDAVKTLQATSLQISVTAQGFIPAPSERGQEGEVQTRASESGYATTFTTGDAIGITVMQGGSIVHNNVKFVYNSSSSWEAANPADKVYAYNGATYIACYPYDAAMTGKTSEADIVAAFTPKTNQCAYADYTASDLMTGTGTVSGTTLNITLTHALSLVEISLSEQKYKAGNSPAEFSKPSLINSLTISGNAATPYLINGSVYRYIVKPAGSSTVNVSGVYEVNGSTAVFTKDITPAEGKYHRLNVSHTGYDTAIEDLAAIDVGVTNIPSGTGWTYADPFFTIAGGANVTLIGSTTTSFVRVESGATATITLNNVTLGASSVYNVPTIDCGDATVTLKLNGTNAVTGQGNAPAIHAGTNTVLTITSAAGDGSTNGTLIATNNQDTGNAGVISSNSNEEGGTIIINGGTVNVTEHGYGAAIGGGRYVAGGNITINGGNVTASATDGAAIGGGVRGAGGSITINGGNVTASATDGAAIGGGYNGAGGSITINSGTVNITTTDDANGEGGAGIGGGTRGAGGNITISGGEININADSYAACIGGGSGDFFDAGGAGGNISISGGVINAANAKGVAIGGGSKTDGLGGSGGTINITGGTVVASSGNVWAIGGGKVFGSGSNGAAATLTLGSSYSWWTNTQPDQTGTAAAGTFPGTPFEADDTQKWVKIAGN